MKSDSLNYRHSCCSLNLTNSWLLFQCIMAPHEEVSNDLTIADKVNAEALLADFKCEKIINQGG